MPEPHIDPFDALREPVIPLDPDPAFAADLRSRLVRAIPTSTTKEPPMSMELARPRNGLRHGDVRCIPLSMPDLARGREFYGAVLGWSFSPGSSEHGVQVDGIAPMTGLSEGQSPAGAG